MTGCILPFSDASAPQSWLATFAQIRAGQALLSMARENGIDIVFDPNIHAGGGGLYDGHTVRISPRLEKHAALGILAHELQHAIQDKNGLFPEHDAGGRFRPLARPMEVLRLARMAEADAHTRQAEFLFDLACKTGHRFPANSQDEDLARVFAQQLDETADNRPAARLAVFQKVITALDVYDRDAATLLRRHAGLDARRRLADPHYAGRAPLRADAATLRRFGAREDGSNYLSSLDDAALTAESFFGAVSPQTALLLESAARREARPLPKAAP